MMLKLVSGGVLALALAVGALVSVPEQDAPLPHEPTATVPSACEARSEALLVTGTLNNLPPELGPADSAREPLVKVGFCSLDCSICISPGDCESRGAGTCGVCRR